jgi:galactose-1-phosphate uridylyltransferase
VNTQEVESGGISSLPEQHLIWDKSSLLLRTQGVKGKAYVICFSPAHNMYSLTSTL